LGDAVTLTEQATGGREQAPLDGGAKHTAVTDDHVDAQTDELMTFVTDRVAPLAKTFAQLPVMQLRVRTAQGMITLVKAAAVAGDGAKAPSAAKSAHAPRIQEGEPGRAYDTINAEAVGVFRTASDVPEFGERVEADRVLGYVEALKLRNPVRAGAPCFFVAQAVEDGQAVEFGEVLFVVERGDTPPQAEPASDAGQESAGQTIDSIDEFGYAFPPPGI
jgi:acetyl-CoA carboxylase biotin carboxyl carrier protein